MGEVFVLLTDCASLDIVCYPLVHVGPPVPFLGFTDRFVPTWVSGCQMVMHEGHDFSYYFSDSWHVDLVFWCDCGDGESFQVK